VIAAGNKIKSPQPDAGRERFWLIIPTDHGFAGHTGQVFFIFQAQMTTDLKRYQPRPMALRLNRRWAIARFPGSLA